jgi:hypothetical protein
MDLVPLFSSKVRFSARGGGQLVCLVIGEGVRKVGQESGESKVRPDRYHAKATSQPTI